MTVIVVVGREVSAILVLSKSVGAQVAGGWCNQQVYLLSLGLKSSVRGDVNEADDIGRY